MGRPARMFQGSEFSRLLVLLAIAVGGWLIVWYNLRQPARPVRRAPAADVPVPPPETSLAFRGIEDKSTISLRDNAAYATLLARVRSTSPDQLAAQSARNVLFSQIWERPERYRGVPIHLEGHALRVVVQDDVGSNLTPKQKLYEVWIVTPDSQNYPIVLVCEDLPAGFPGGNKLSERISFNGYFLKLLAYKAGDVPRAAPMLIGRLIWFRFPQFEEGNSSGGMLNWAIIGMSALTLYALLRWVFHLRRSMSPAPRRTIIHSPVDQIAPEVLSHWIEQAEESDESEIEGDSQQENRQ